jgi:hypothetical protein
LVRRKAGSVLDSRRPKGTDDKMPVLTNSLIAWAAIKKVNDVSGITYTGASHALIAYHNPWLRGATPLICGFMTIHGKFVTRGEAAMLAQIPNRKQAMSKDFEHLTYQKGIEEMTIQRMGQWDKYCTIKDQFKKTEV